MNNLSPDKQNALDLLRAKTYFWAQLTKSIKVESLHGDDYFDFDLVYRIDDLVDSDFISVLEFENKDRNKNIFSVSIVVKKDTKLKHIKYNFENEIVFNFPRVYFGTKCSDQKKVEKDPYTYPTAIFFDTSDTMQETVRFDHFIPLYLSLNFKHIYLGPTSYKEIAIFNEFHFAQFQVATHDPYGVVKISKSFDPRDLIFLLSYHPSYQDHQNTTGLVAISNTENCFFHMDYRFVNKKLFAELL